MKPRRAVRYLFDVGQRRLRLVLVVGGEALAQPAHEPDQDAFAAFDRSLAALSAAFASRAAAIAPSVNETGSTARSLLRRRHQR